MAISTSEFIKLWNDKKLSNEEVAIQAGYTEFKSVYNRKAKLDAVEKSKIKVNRSATIDPTVKTGKKDKVKKEKPSRAVPVKEEKVAESSESPLNSIVTVTLEFKDSSSRKQERQLESTDVNEIWAGIQELKTKYGNNNANLVDNKTRVNVTTSTQLKDGMTISMIRIPTGG